MATESAQSSSAFNGAVRPLSHLPPGSYSKSTGNLPVNLPYLPPVARFSPRDSRKILRISQLWASSCTVCHFNSGVSSQLAPLKYIMSTAGRAMAASEAPLGHLEMCNARIPVRISLWNLVEPPISVARSFTASSTCCSSIGVHPAGLKTRIRYSLANLSSMAALDCLSTTGLPGAKGYYPPGSNKGQTYFSRKRRR